MIERAMQLFERLVDVLEKMYEAGRELPSNINIDYPEQNNWGDDEGPDGLSGGKDEFDTGLEKTTPPGYEEILKNQGLPALKQICTDRGMDFLPAARANTILALLKKWDEKQVEAPKDNISDVYGLEETPVDDPFAAEEPTVDPLATIPAKEEVDPFAAEEEKPVKKVTEAQVRETLQLLHIAVEKNRKGEGNAAVVAIIKRSGVLMLKELKEDRYAFTVSEAEAAIALEIK